MQTNLLSKNIKTLIITNIPAPYRIPLWNILAQQVDLTLYFMSYTEINRKWNILLDKSRFKFKILKGIHLPLRKGEFTLHFNYSIFTELKKNNFDIIICGSYDSVTVLLAVLYAKLKRKKIVLWYESVKQSALIKKGILYNLKRTIINMFDKYLVPGHAAKDNLLSFGINEDAIFIAPNSVDNKLYFKAKLKKNNSLVNKYPRKNILFVGSFVKRKGIKYLIDAYENLCFKEEIGLIIVGDGVLSNELKQYCLGKGLKNVFFEGYKNQEQLCEYYGFCDVLVLPSFLEVWGLVVNEAMAAGMPIICSKYAGCAPDLVIHGENGYIIDPEDTETFSKYLSNILNNTQLQKSMGLKSLEIIKNYTPQKTADGFLRCIDTIKNDIISRK
jgi:glycosyltransferase involved in cell wall biosynthesis